uniref:ATP synthase subunit a n=1 Tax=Hypsauchenia hardwickii TaxID=2605027 RepID=A0A5B9T369_9HEMI|nr:ATP synthase F0 subunit 6 [Hypsauchenia hardwickii]QEG98435.1 ATP synthase F0 subunit 6 [Hypsauchenia hardwickii]
MMMNLFSTFDPCTGLISLNWMSSAIFVIMFNYNYWLNYNNMIILFIIIKSMKLELTMLMNHKGSYIIMLTLSIFILVNNLMGLLPYIFTSSSHLIFSLSLALPLWLSFMIYGWFNKMESMFIHLLPMGTPSILMPFMILIETISNLIRPGSLAVRLTANMIAGHLLMSLLGNSFSMAMMVIIFIFIMLMIFEIAVSLIQSYVFMILLTLYSSEI